MKQQIKNAIIPLLEIYLQLQIESVERVWGDAGSGDRGAAAAYEITPIREMIKWIKEH